MSFEDWDLLTTQIEQYYVLRQEQAKQHEDEEQRELLSLTPRKENIL